MRGRERQKMAAVVVGILCVLCIDIVVGQSNSTVPIVVSSPIETDVVSTSSMLLVMSSDAISSFDRTNSSVVPSTSAVNVTMMTVNSSSSFPSLTSTPTPSETVQSLSPTLSPSSQALTSSVVFPSPSPSQVSSTASPLLDSTSMDQPGTTSPVSKPGGEGSSGDDDDVVVAAVLGTLAAVLVVLAIVVAIVVVFIVMKRRRKNYPNTVFSNAELTTDSETVDATNQVALFPRGGAPAKVDRSPIPVGEFPTHVKRLHQDADRGFEEEYWTLPNTPTLPFTAAKLRCNHPKNRFDNVFPYDHSRVKLAPLQGLEGSDYINASFLDGYNKESAYIAAQGPLKSTVGDFWRMVWEHKLFTIVMLTETLEAGRVKCEQYWPNGINESWEVGNNLLVTLVEQRPYAEYKVKILTVEDTSQPEPCPFTVTHYHFSAWPDHGVPADKTSLIQFIQRVRKAHPYENSVPLMVHCSAGVGRTGTLMVLDSMIQRMKTEDSVNVYEFLYELRTKRVLMVQTPIQYAFIHDALEEFITCGDTSIAVSNLRTAVKKLENRDSDHTFAQQFKLLEEVSCRADDVNCSDGKAEENKEKNRYMDKLPYDKTRVFLRPTAVKGSDYINASFVDGYKKRRAYIAAQAPMESTVSDFWRMMWEHQSRVIVMLCDLTEDGTESSYRYWPEETGTPVVYGRLKVEKTSEEDTADGYTVRKFQLTQDNSNPVTGAPDAVVITQFHHTAWPEHGYHLSSSSVLKIINALIKTQMTTGNHSITVMCNDGVGRTGTFVCIYSELEKIKVEATVDVFQYIKASRFHRPGLVSTVEQYKFCHDVIIDFLDSFDTYANFKQL